MTEIKVCPFCGEMPEIEQNECRGKHEYIIMCCNTKCSIQPMTEPREFSYKIRAIANAHRQWNRRF